MRCGRSRATSTWPVRRCGQRTHGGTTPHLTRRALRRRARQRQGSSRRRHPLRREQAGAGCRCRCQRSRHFRRGPHRCRRLPADPQVSSAKVSCVLMLASLTLLFKGQIGADVLTSFPVPPYSPAASPFVPPARHSPAAAQSASGHGIPGHDDGSATRNAHTAPAVGAASRPPATAASRTAAGCTRRSRSVGNGHLCLPF